MIPSFPTVALRPIEGLVGPKDLSVEEYREYYDLANGTSYRIDNPVAFYYREGGSTHRVVDAEGVVHCVPFGAGQSVILRWKNRGVTSGADPLTY